MLEKGTEKVRSISSAHESAPAHLLTHRGLSGSHARETSGLPFRDRLYWQLVRSLSCALRHDDDDLYWYTILNQPRMQPLFVEAMSIKNEA